MQIKNIKGAIIVNPYGRQNLSLAQAKRLQEEFSKYSITVPIITALDSEYSLGKNGVVLKTNNLNFAVYLDKDKYFSKALTDLGVRLFNKHEGIRECDDKGITYLKLAKNGYKIPKTILAPLCYLENQEITLKDAKVITNQLSFPIIVKESYGSLGQGVYKANNKSELLSLMNALKLKPHLYQEYIGNKVGEDVRVIMVGGKVVASMRRKNPTDFRSNLYQGGTSEKITLDKKWVEIAQNVSKLFDLDYCGIDFLDDGTDTPVICEVNSNAFFEGIEKTTGINVAKAYVEHILNNL